jgi:hypothetical protein
MTNNFKVIKVFNHDRDQEFFKELKMNEHLQATLYNNNSNTVLLHKDHFVEYNRFGPAVLCFKYASKGNLKELLDKSHQFMTQGIYNLRPNHKFIEYFSSF